MVTATTARTELLRTAASQALLAPSVHNTQPWRFVLSADRLDIHADRSRRLPVLDPGGRQLIISCGCALFNARVSLASRGYDAVVEQFPDPGQPDLVARIVLPAEPSEQVEIGALDRFIISRQTNRRRYAEEPVPAEVVRQLIESARAEQAALVPVQSMSHRLAVARLTQQAEQLENANPAYRAELRAWTSDGSGRRDGVPALAVPHVTGEACDDLPIRDFDTRGTGSLPAETGSGLDQCLLLLGTVDDDELAWLQAGEALEHAWLEATRLGYVASLFTQPIEIPQVRQMLRFELELAIRPQLLLRVGKAPLTGSSRRRGLSDVLVDGA
jgi:nitroreductase family protein